MKVRDEHDVIMAMKIADFISTMHTMNTRENADFYWLVDKFYRSKGKLNIDEPLEYKEGRMGIYYWFHFLEQTESFGIQSHPATDKYSKEELYFAIFVMESYKREYTLSNIEVLNLFIEKRLLETLVHMYEPWHTQGLNWIFYNLNKIISGEDTWF